MKNFFNSLFGNSIRILFGILLAVIIIFIWQNWSELTGPVTLKFIGSAEYPLWVWLTIIFTSGNASWALFSFKNKRQLKKSLNQKNNELIISKKELDKFRNLSVTDDMQSDNSAAESPDTPDEKGN